MNNAIVLHYSLYQDIYAAYLDDFRYKNTHTCEWNAMKIYERGKFQNYFIHNFYFSLVKIYRSNRFLTEISSSQATSFVSILFPEIV